MRALLLCAAVLAAPVSAQRLTITPDTLRFDGQQVRTMVLRNDTAAPISFDSLRFERGRPADQTSFFWIMSWRVLRLDGFFDSGQVQCGTNFFGNRAAGGLRCETDLDGRVVPPGGEVEFEQVYLDCACRGGAPRRGGYDDVAVFYSGGEAEPQRVPFLDVVVNDAEGGPGAGALAVGRVVPNPARGAAALGVTLAGPGVVRVDVLDALGRIARRAPARRLPAGTHALRLDLSALPSGVYVARVVAETSAGAGWAVRRVTVTR